MKKFYLSQVLITTLFVIADIIGTICSVLGLEILLYGLDFADKISVYKIVNTALALLFFQICFFLLSGVYKKYWQTAGFTDFAKLLFSTLFILFPMIPLSIIPKSVFLPTDHIFTATLLCAVLSCFTRALLHMYHRMAVRIVKKHGNKKSSNRLLIVGAGEAGQIVARDVSINTKLNYNVIGFVDDDPSKLGMTIKGVEVLGRISDIKRVCEEKEITNILYAIPSADEETTKEILNLCNQTECKVKIVPSLDQIISSPDKSLAKRIRDVQIEDLLPRSPIVLDNGALKDSLGGKVVMVTGGGGSIGSELCKQIAVYEPSQLIIVDIYENNAYDLTNELLYLYPDLNIKTLIASVRDKDRMDSICKQYKPSVIFHAAAHKHVPLMEDSPCEAIKNNVFGTLNMVQCAAQNNIPKFVMISTDKAVNPTNVMGATKRLCEIIVQAYQKISSTNFVAVRFGNVLGSNGSVIPLFKRQIARGGPVTLTHKEITRFFMTIPEAAQLVLQASLYAKGGEIFVLDMGQPVKIYDLAMNMIKLSGYVPYEDIDIQITGLRPGEKLYEELLMSEEGLGQTAHNKIFIGKPSFAEFEELKPKLEALYTAAHAQDEQKTRELLMDLVPTFKPANN